MGDITIDYDLLHSLAQQMYALRDKIDAASKTSHDFTATDIGPDPKAATSISDFYTAWKGAFGRAWDAMTSLGDDINDTANDFYQLDAGMAAQINEGTAQQNVQTWQAPIDQYNQLKGKTYTVEWTNAKGHLRHEQMPLIDPSDAPPRQGPQPDSLVTKGADGSTITTHLTYDGNQLTGTQTTVDAPGGLSYSETTVYTANNGYTTTIHNPDGSVSIITVVAQPDGSATKTMTDGNGNIEGEWVGNVDTNQWQQTKAGGS